MDIVLKLNEVSNIFFILAIIISFHAHGSTVGKGCFNDNLKSPECRTTTFGDFYFMLHYKNLSLENITEVVDGVLITEEWRNIKDYEGYYQVSNFGRVKRLPTVIKYTRWRNGDTRKWKEKIIKQCFSKGYLRLSLAMNGKIKNISVHQLVGINFIANPENKIGINHKKGIKTDNRSWELEWATSLENTQHAHKMGLVVRPLGADNPLSIQTYQYSLKGELIKIWDSTRTAERNGFHSRHVSACCLGKGRSHYGYVWSYTELSKDFFANKRFGRGGYNKKTTDTL